MESVNNSGTFAEVSCPRLLVHLHQTRFDGTLRVTQPGPVKLLYFQRGEIAMASSNDSRDHLAPILIREGKLKSEQLDLARKSAKPGTSLARVLVQMGFLTSGELFAGARQQLRQIVGSLLCLTDAQYSMEKDHFPREVTSLNVDTREMILDLVRKISERTFILSEVGSPDTRWQPVPAFSEMVAASRLPNPWKELAGRFASPRTTHEFGQSAGLDDFEASKVVYGLQLMGLLKSEIPAAREEPVPAIVPAPPERRRVEEPIAAPEESPKAEPEMREGEQRSEFHAVSARAAVSAGPEVRGVAAPIFFENRDEPNAPGGGRPAEDSRPQEKEEPGDRVPTSDGEAIRLEFKGPVLPSAPAARRRSGLGSILSILTGLVILASAFYWFVFLREPEAEGDSAPPPTVVQEEKAPNTDSAPPGEEPPRAGSPEALAMPSPKTGSEPGPTQEGPPSVASGPAANVPPSHPDLSPPVEPPPRSFPAPPEAPAPSFSDAGRFVEARGNLDQGKYRDAAAAWLTTVQEEKSKRFTLQIAIACQEESLRTAAARTRGSVSFFAVPFDLGGKPCFRLCWGAYGTIEEAQSDKNAVPGFFMSEGGTPVVVSLGKLLPKGDR